MCQMQNQNSKFTEQWFDCFLGIFCNPVYSRCEVIITLKMSSLVITWCWITLTDSLIHFIYLWSFFAKTNSTQWSDIWAFHAIISVSTWLTVTVSSIFPSSSELFFLTLVVRIMWLSVSTLWRKVPTMRKPVTAKTKAKRVLQCFTYRDRIEFGCIHVNEVHGLIAATKLPVDRQVAWKRILLKRGALTN